MKKLAFILTAAGVSACSTFRSYYVPPPPPELQAYLHADLEAHASLDRWWRRYEDPNLNALIDEALQRNNDLLVATLRVRAASAIVHLAVINPTVSAAYIDEYSRPFSGSAYPRSRVFSGAASYELDLWGRLGALKDAARWESRATVQDRETARLLLVGTAVSLYFQLGALNEQIELGQESVAYARKALALTQVLTDAGSDSRLEVVQAQQVWENQEVSQSHLVQQRVEARNTLTVLLNGAPWPEGLELTSLPMRLAPPVEAGLPAKLLSRRPDLRAADLRLRESLASVDATRLSFYPQISLTGALGSASIGLAQLLQNPAATLAGTITVPLIQFNQAKYSTQLARTQYEEATVAFRQTLMQALYDVDSVLSARTELREQGARLQASLRDAREVEKLSEIRYQVGAVSLRSWLDAQEARRQATGAVTASRLARLQNDAALCQALGGDTSENESGIH